MKAAEKSGLPEMIELLISYGVKRLDKI